MSMFDKLRRSVTEMHVSCCMEPRSAGGPHVKLLVSTGCSYLECRLQTTASFVKTWRQNADLMHILFHLLNPPHASLVSLDSHRAALLSSNVPFTRDNVPALRMGVSVSSHLILGFPFKTDLDVLLASLGSFLLRLNWL